MIRGRKDGIEQSKIEGALDLLIRIGTRRFGPPPAHITVALSEVDSAERMNKLTDRVLVARSWAELIASA